jgi:hypothetical protein
MPYPFSATLSLRAAVEANLNSGSGAGMEIGWKSLADYLFYGCPMLGDSLGLLKDSKSLSW